MPIDRNSRLGLLKLMQGPVMYGKKVYSTLYSQHDVRMKKDLLLEHLRIGILKTRTV